MTTILASQVTGSSFPSTYNLNFHPAQLGAAIAYAFEADQNVTEASGAVSAWGGTVAASGIQMIQTTPANQMVYTASAQNGLPGVKNTTGTLPGSFMKTQATVPAAQLLTATPFLLTTAISLNTSSGGAIISQMNGTDGSPGWGVIGSSTVGLYLFNQTGQQRFSRALLAAAKHILSWTYDGSNTVAGLKMYVDGVLQTDTTYDNTTGTPDFTSTGYLGLNIDDGSSPDLTESYAHYLVTGASAVANRVNMENYLNTKWAIF